LHWIKDPEMLRKIKELQTTNVLDLNHVNENPVSIYTNFDPKKIYYSNCITLEILVSFSEMEVVTDAYYDIIEISTVDSISLSFFADEHADSLSFIDEDKNPDLVIAATETKVVDSLCSSALIDSAMFEVPTVKNPELVIVTTGTNISQEERFDFFFM
jgi:hypothetical protein